MPSVSVVMPVFNCRRFIGEAISSIQRQSVRDWELIVIDDGSTDASAEIVRQQMAGDERIRLIQSGHRGVAAARNAGIQAACGKFIATMDADDVSLPDRFLHQLNGLAVNSDLVVIGGDYDLIDENSRILDQKSPSHRKPLSPEACRKTLELGGCPLCASTTVIRREALTLVGGYRSQMDLAEDYDLWLRLARVGEIGNVAQKVVRYRIHRHSGTFTRPETQFAGILKAIISNKGLETHNEKSIGELLEIAAAGEDLPKFLVSRAERYSSEMAELGHFSDSIRLARLFSRYAPAQHRHSVFWEFMLRSVAAAANCRSRSSALLLLLRYILGSQQLTTLWTKKEELHGLLSALMNKTRCVTTEAGKPSGTIPCGHLDNVIWTHDRRMVWMNGWARFYELGWKPTFLIHLAERNCRTMIKRTMRPDVAEALGENYLFSGFEIMIRFDHPEKTDMPPISVLSGEGKARNVEEAGASVHYLQ